MNIETNKNTKTMKALKITVELAFNNECIFLTYKNETVFNVMNVIKRKYKGAIIYSVNAEY